MVKKSGGFEKMELPPEVFRAIKAKGYNLPTPIQRKAIPMSLSGQDIIAIARTGSGKTAAFLIPIFQRLKVHSNIVGARAVVISPTRELAYQTLKFALDLGKYTSLKFAALVGGDGLKSEFNKLAENPDILIATPGRLLHFILELNYSLANVEMVVLDEADRLVEMGLMEQVSSILSHMKHPNRQTLCFSATLPEVLTDFSKTGLSNPVLIKLDQEHKLPEELDLDFFMVRKEDKEALLLHIITHIIDLSKDQLSIIFVATRHHVEYMEFLLNSFKIPAVGLYGAMDQEARTRALEMFRKSRRNFLITTDLAARGLDIPLLDNVIHYDFAYTPKLFIHRSGRVARAGRPGHCYCLATQPDVPYLIDVLMHLSKTDIETIGHFPESVIRDAHEEYSLAMKEVNLEELDTRLKSVNNALKIYNKTKQGASDESVRRAKQFQWGIHPNYKEAQPEEEFYQKIKEFKPTMNMLELSAKLSGKGEIANRMKEERLNLQKRPREQAKPEQVNEEEEKELEVMVREGISKKQEQISKPSKRQKRGQKTDFKDSSYLSYEGERTFEKDKEFSQLAMELPMEDETGLRKSTKMKWDKKKGKYIQDQKKKKFLVDNKAKDLYKEWTKTTKKRIQKVGEKEDPDNMKKNTGRSRAPSDLKNKQQLVKEKKKAIKKNAILKHKKAKERQFASRQKTRYEKSSVAPRSKMIVKK